MSSSSPSHSNFMYLFGAIILSCVAIYFLLLAIDSFGLEEKKAKGRVISKGYRQGGKTYITQIVANRPVVLPQVKPEMYILEVEIQGKRAECVVDPSLFGRIEIGEEITVVYQKRRILGKIQVIKVIH